jgi:ABC-type transport system involved in cytochrome c biogenesis permease subunit
MLVLSLSFAAYLFSLWKRPLLYAGLLLQVFYVVSRGIDLGRIPLVGPHDKDSSYFEFIASVAAVFTVFALTSKPHSGHLPPVLQTIWFECHVVLAFMSYALFGIAAVLGYMNLNKRDVLLEGLQYRAVLIGYLLFTLSMIFGGIWAYLAWGTYWVWTPKELWTSILWAYYSFYLHARLRQWWTGRAMAYLGITGFGVVLFTYLGVSLLMKSSHSF